MTRRSGRRSRTRQAVFTGGLVAVCVVLAEACAYVLVFLSGLFGDEPIPSRRTLLERQSEGIQRLVHPIGNQRTAIDSLLGWRYLPGSASKADHISSQGLRGVREYDARPREGTRRIAAFGDSFVYGNEVADADAWPAQVERMYPDLEVLNYGVGGYGVDQAFLRFLVEGQLLSPELVVVGFYTDDLSRLVNRFRPFRSSAEAPLAKPRFVLQDSLVLVASPLRTYDDYTALLRAPARVSELGQLDWWYRPFVYEGEVYRVSASARVLLSVWDRLHRRYIDSNRLWNGQQFNEESEAFRLQVALFHAFCKEAERRAIRVMVVFLPDRESVRRALVQEQSLYEPLVRATRSRGIPYVDLLGSLAEAGAAHGADALFASGGHYSPRGNQVVAAALGALLSRDGPEGRNGFKN